MKFFLNFGIWVVGYGCNSLLQSLQQSEQGYSDRGSANPPKRSVKKAVRFPSDSCLLQKKKRVIENLSPLLDRF